MEWIEAFNHEFLIKPVLISKLESKDIFVAETNCRVANIAKSDTINFAALATKKCCSKGHVI